MRPWRRTVPLALVGLLGLASLLRAQIEQQIPGDAVMVIKVNKLDQTNGKLIKFFKDLGLDQVVPPLANPLGALQAQAKMTNGVDVAGDLAFVMVDPEQHGVEPDEALLVLIPVSDYDAFVGNFGQAETVDGVSQVTIGSAGEPGYVARRGAYAALSPTRTVAAEKPSAALKVAGLSAGQWAEHDVLVYANLPAIRAKVSDDLAEGREMITQQIAQGMAQEPEAAKYSATVNTLVGQVFNAVDAFLRDGEAATIGITFAPGGIRATVVSQFAGDSYLGGVASKIKGSTAPMVVGLPVDATYLMYGGGAGGHEAIQPVLDDFLAPITDELKKADPAIAGKVDAYLAGIRQYLASEKSQTFGLFAPSGNLGQEAILQFAAISSGDSKQLLSAYRTMMSGQDELMRLMPGNQNMTTKVTHDAVTLAGVKFDEVVTTYGAGDPNDPVAAQQQQMMAILYGPAGQRMLTGVVSDNLLLTVSGINDDLVARVVESAKSGEGGLESRDAIKTVAAALPSNRVAAVYVNVGDIVTTALTYAAQFGMAVPLQLPPDMPPVGATIGAEQSSLRVDVYIPQALVQNLVSAGMQAFMQMQGGGGGGGL